MLDAMYWSEKTNEILSLWYCTYSSLINISLIWWKKTHLWLTYTRVLKQASILEIQKWKKETLTLKCSTSNNISEYLTLQLILTYLQKQTSENLQQKIWKPMSICSPPQKNYFVTIFVCLTVYVLLLHTKYQLLTYVLHTRYSMFHFILRFSSETRERNKQIHSDWKQKCLSSCLFRCISRELKTKYQISLFWYLLLQFSNWMFHFLLRFSSETRERNKQIHSDWKQKKSFILFLSLHQSGTKN